MSDEQIDLFDFLRLVAVAQARGQLTRMQASVATLTALDSSGTSGTGVVVNAERTAAELGISQSQVWRHFGALGNWFEQTAKPTRGAKGAPGRRARYRCLWPALDLGVGLVAHGNTAVDRVAPTSEEARDESAADRLATSRENVRNDEPKRLAPAVAQLRDETPSDRVASAGSQLRHGSDPIAESSRSFEPNRLAVSPESSRIPERGTDTVPTSDGSPSDGPTGPTPLGGSPQDAHATCSHWDDANKRPTLAADGTCWRPKCEAQNLCGGCIRMSRLAGPIDRCDEHREAG